MPAPATTRAGTARRRSHTRLMRRATTSPTTPMPAHISWRLKMKYGLLPRCAWVWAVADSTITRPSMTKAVTTTAMT